MSANRFGSHLVITTFGESHGQALGVVVEGCPGGIAFDYPLLRGELERRRPGTSRATSQRKEPDLPRVLSGVFEERTLGTPIAIIVENQDCRSADYQDVPEKPRIGHVDDLWKKKFGHQDWRGGGRSSGRETVSRVMGGAVAKMILSHLHPNLKVVSFISRIGNLTIASPYEFEAKRGAIEAMLAEARTSGESYGAEVAVVIENPPVCLGQPVFHKLKAELAAAALSIGGVVGFEFGKGFEVCSMKGTQFHTDHHSEWYGGIRGGLSTGEPILFRVAFKPTSSIGDIAIQGRHDPCIALRAQVVVEAMSCLVLADQALLLFTDQLNGL